MSRHLSHDETFYSIGSFASVAALKAFNTTILTIGRPWAYVDTEGEYFYVPGDATTESLPNVIQPTTGSGRWFKKPITSISSYSLVKTLAVASGGGGGSSKARLFYDFSQNGQASGTTGLFTKAAISSAATAYPTTSPFDLGINNGTLDPYTIPFACKVKSVRITLAQSSISGAGPVSVGVTLRLDLYKVLYSTRTLLASYDIVLDNTKVNTFNNLGADGFQTASLSGLSTQLQAGDLIGLQFTNRSSGTNVINAAGRIYTTMEVLED